LGGRDGHRAAANPSLSPPRKRPRPSLPRPASDHGLWRAKLTAFAADEGDGSDAEAAAREPRTARPGRAPSAGFFDASRSMDDDDALLAALAAAEEERVGKRPPPAGDVGAAAAGTPPSPPKRQHRLSLSSSGGLVGGEAVAGVAGAGVDRAPPRAPAGPARQAGAPPPLHHHHPVSSPLHLTPPPRPPRALEVASYLPPDLLHAWTAAGNRDRLYPWQAAALGQAGVLSGRGLVFAAPTSAGKTAVAEILALRRAYVTGRPALFVFPFNALCKEKADRLDALLKPAGRRVVRLFDRAPNANAAANVGAYVANFERGSALVSRLLQEGCLASLGCVVIDELHMLGDPGRGFLLELLLAKLKFGTRLADGVGVGGGGGGARATPSAVPSTTPATPGSPSQSLGVQIVGMSATLPNAGAVAAWLGAALYVTDFRPVPLTCHLVEGGAVSAVTAAGGAGAARPLTLPPRCDGLAPSDDDVRVIAALAREATTSHHSTLIFCGTKARARHTAVTLARLLGPLPDRTRAGGRPRRDAVARLATLDRVDPGLLEALRCGVAFHHADLPPEARRIVEAAYRDGGAAVLAATSTLAAGVNLPARRVVFRDTFIGVSSNRLDGARFAQMAGRAGRAGIDEAGEAYVLCPAAAPATERDRLRALLLSTPPPVHSCLPDRSCLRRAIFETVALGAVADPADVLRFLDCTFGWNENPREKEEEKEKEEGGARSATAPAPSTTTASGRQTMVDATKTVLRELVEERLIEWRRSGEGNADGRYAPTAAGVAASSAGLSPCDATAMAGELLEVAQKGVVLRCDLHLVFLAVPPGERLARGDRADAEAAAAVDHYVSRASGPGHDARRAVALRVGVDDGLLVAARHGAGAPRTRAPALHRLHAALAVDALVQERTPATVAAAFGVHPHRLASLQEAAAQRAGRAAAFARGVGGGLDALADLLATTERRIAAGARPELLALTQIALVKAGRARRLHRAGLLTAADVADADAGTVADILSGNGADEAITPGIVARIQASAARLAEVAARQAADAADAADAAAADDAAEQGLMDAVEQAVLLASSGTEEEEGAVAAAASHSPLAPASLPDRLFDAPTMLPPLPLELGAPFDEGGGRQVG